MKQKTLLILVVITLLLLGCVPTPKQEYVVNKKDNAVEQKLNQEKEGTGEGSLSPQRLPDRWDEVCESETMILTFHAPLLQKEDGLYPLYRTRANPLTEAQIVTCLNILFPSPVTVRQNRPTKADIQREMEWYIQEAEAKLAWQDAGRPDDGVDRDETPLTREEVNEELANYQKLIYNAPEENQETPVTAYRVPEPKEGLLVYRLSSGDSLILSHSYEGSLYAGIGNKFCDVYKRYDWEMDKDDEDVRPFTPVTADRETCEQVARDAVEKLGIEGMTLVETEEANLMDGRECLSGGYECLFVRDFGGYPYLGSNYEPAQYLTYGSDDSFMANQHIRAEELRLFADEEIVKVISYDAPKMVVGIESRNIELLPFDQAQARIQQGLVYGLSQWAMDRQKEDPNGAKMNVEIYKIGLTSYTLHIPDSEDCYEMPCYAVFFDPWNLPDRIRNGKGTTQEVLLINAVDGSIVHTDYGF